MFSSDEILARLQDGDDAMMIAQEMTNALNRAIEQKKIADEAAETEAQIGRKGRVNEVADWLGQSIDWLYRWYPELCSNTEAEVEANKKKLPELAEGIIDLLDSLVEMANVFGTKMASDFARTMSPAKIVEVPVDKNGEVDKILNAFLAGL